MKVQVYGIIKKAVEELMTKPGIFVDKNKKQTRIEYSYQDPVLNEKGVCEAVSIPEVNGISHPKVDYYQLVVGVKTDIDGLVKVFVDGAEKQPFYQNQEIGVKKYSFR